MSLLFEIPDEVWCLVLEFGTYNLSQVMALQLINVHFRHIMCNPIMVSHLSVAFKDLEHLQHKGLLQHGVRYIKAPRLQASAPLACLSYCTALRCLNLSHGKFEAEGLEAGIALLCHLEQLDLSFCNQLVRLDSLPATLRVLDVTSCIRLVALPALPNLEQLDASHCRRLRTLPDLPALVSVDVGYGSTSLAPPNTLRHLKIAQTNVPDAHSMTSLESLCLVNSNFEQQQWCCAPLANLSELALVFVSYRKAHDLSCLSVLKSLRKLHLEIGVSDENLVSLESLVNLKALVIGSELISDDGLVSIGKMRGLETLYLNKCRRKQITGEGLVALVPLSKLVSLHLSECYGVRYNMGGLSTLVHLQTLCIDNDSNLAGYWPVTPEEEMLDQMAHQDDLEPLINLPNLKVLELVFCNVMSLAWVNQIPRLEMLVAKGCRLTLEGLWDLMPCNIGSVVLGENARVTLGYDVERFRQSMPSHGRLSFENENM